MVSTNNIGGTGNKRGNVNGMAGVDIEDRKQRWHVPVRTKIRGGYTKGKLSTYSGEIYAVAGPS